MLRGVRFPRSDALSGLSVRPLSVCCSQVIVAVRQGSLMGTAFHPEITADTRWCAPEWLPRHRHHLSSSAPLLLGIVRLVEERRPMPTTDFVAAFGHRRRRHKLFADMCAKGPGPAVKGAEAPSTAHKEVPYIKPAPLPVR